MFNRELIYHKEVVKMNTNEKLREALLTARNVIRDFNFSGEVDPRTYESEIKAIDEALALPRRNCDVGTAEEQSYRFSKFCASNSSNIGGTCSPHCPCIRTTSRCHCLCKWSQMPYEEVSK